MVTCPKCNQTVLDTSAECQFCGCELTPSPASPTYDDPVRHYSQGPEAWIWLAYYAVAGYWVLGGIFDILRGIGVLKESGLEGDLLSLVIGILMTIGGLGLLFKVELIRGAVNLFAFILIILGVINLILAFMLTAVFGPLGLLMMVTTLIDISTAIFVIFLIGETDEKGANF